MTVDASEMRAAGVYERQRLTADSFRAWFCRRHNAWYGHAFLMCSCRRYRWWACSVSREHVKLGPIAAGWYRWPTDGLWRIDVFLLNRWVIFRNRALV